MWSGIWYNIVQMQSGIRVVAYEGGALRELSTEESSREAVLALPFSRLIVKMIRVPAESAGDLVGYAKPILQAMCPYPDEELTVSCEVMRETSEGTLVLAAALVESTAEDICEVLDARGLDITRVDAIELGIVRGLWGSIAKDDARRILVIRGVEGISLLVMDGDLPCAVRSVENEEDLSRQVMFLLLEAEDFDGAKGLEEIVAVGELGLDEIADLASVRRLEVGEDAGLAGVQERSNEAGALNVLPVSWAEVLEESRLKAKLVKGLSIAGGIWVLIMGVLFGGPMVYGMMTEHEKGLSAEHREKYEEVKTQKADVQFVKRCSDHTRGALEVMRAMNECLPGDMTVTRFEITNGGEEGDGNKGAAVSALKVSGECETQEGVLKFEENMRAYVLAGEEDNLFLNVTVGKTASSKNRWKVDLGCTVSERKGDVQ